MRFIINTFTKWEEPPRARHQLTYALAKIYDVTFIAANKIGWPYISQHKINDKILLIQPVFPIDTRLRYRIPLLNELYQIWLYRALKKKFGKVEVINFDFSGYLIHKFFNTVYYYCNDNFSAISKKINFWPIFKYHEYCEKRLSKKAAYCFATSAMLAENLEQFNKRTYEIPLGGPDITEYKIKPGFNNNKDKTINIGLVGFISHDKLSSDLINSILDNLDCKLSLIGPVSDDFIKSIKDKTRVSVLGVLTGENLYNEVNKFDVAIAPYLHKKTDEGNIPNKVFLYIALGKPVVISAMNGLKRMIIPEKLLYTVERLNEFPDVIMQAHSENSPELVTRRINYGLQNTWEKRIEKFLSIISEKYS